MLCLLQIFVKCTWTWIPLPPPPLPPPVSFFISFHHHSFHETMSVSFSSSLPLIKIFPRHFSVVMVFCVVVIIVLLLFPSACSASCNPDDQLSLLSLLSNISSSPPLNWSSPGDCCNWEGVGCDDQINGRVTHLWLPSSGLSGSLPPSILNLTSLSHLNLSRNRFTGSLPKQFFSSLSSLQVLDLSFNGFSGELPSGDVNGSVPRSNLIQIIDLSSNHLHGSIVPEEPDWFLQGAFNLTVFNVSNNSFTQLLPITLCRISYRSLTVLDLSYNDFEGQFPSGIGECSKLQTFRAGFNNLSGPVPDDVYRISRLEQLSLPFNHLSGPISDAVSNLEKLRILELFSNQFVGTIPEGIGGLSNLEMLLLYNNNLTGALPQTLMNCTNLTALNLRANSFKGQLSDFDFSKFLRLSSLDLSNNNFTGELPRSIYSCISLTAIRLASNQFEGPILRDIVALRYLSFLSISTNRLTNITGAIRVLMGCKNLTTVILSKNFFNEAIPDDEITVDANGFQNLEVLALGGCQLTGQVPGWLAKLRSLQVLDLSVNQLTGTIPRWFGSLPNLFYMDLSSNKLSGEFPKELTQLKALVFQEADEQDRSYLELPMFVMPNNVTNLQYNQLSSMPPAIYLGNNSLTGEIPTEIGQLKYLHVFDLSNNNFYGSIPDGLSNLTNLEKLDLSGNRLSGEIPSSLKGLHFLSSFSVAYNNLQGPVPSGGQFDTFPSASFVGNPGLCGSILQRACPSPSGTSQPTSPHNRTNTNLIVGLVLGIFFGTGMFVGVLALWISSKRRIIPGGDTDKIEMQTISSNSFSEFSPEDDKDTSLVMLFPSNENEIKDFTIYELLKATDNFNQANIVGCGGFGLVYRATLANGTKLAVKKLSGDLGFMDREFKAEVEALSTAQHENLVSLQGYCVHNGFRLLIYSYMENGSLDYWLHEKPDGAAQLDWPSRLRIARGASCGLAYMHQICEPHIVHRDIKSSNILLDEKFEAHLADFGLSRLILPYRTHVTTELVGTLGYIPPEYGQAWVATLRGDIYSFGVVMLELLTGRRPVEISKPKVSRELVGWVQQMRSEGKQDQVFDQLLRGKGFEDEMLQFLDVACMCVNQNPFKRPTIMEVVDWLKNVGSHRNQNKD